MKSSLIFVCIFLCNGLGAAPMSRVTSVVDSHTLIIETGGRRSRVTLAGIAVEASQEAAATAYLRELVDGAWVLIDRGRIYRSPDALDVSAAMERRAWLAVPGMRVLGLSRPAERRDDSKPKESAAKRPRASSASRPAGRPPARIRRVRSRHPG